LVNILLPPHGARLFRTTAICSITVGKMKVKISFLPILVSFWAVTHDKLRIEIEIVIENGPPHRG